MKALAEIKNLHKSYGREATRDRTAASAPSTAVAVLDNVQFSLYRNEFVVITGRSGSGKSTLLNILGAMDTPDSGEVVIENQNICAFSDETRARYRRRQIGFIFQSYNLIPTLTVRENLLLPVHLAAVPNPPAVDELLAAVRLADKADYWPDRLSGGEQQRIAIIRALIHRPQLVLADEPTGNLDKDNAIAVVEMLSAMVKQHDTTLVLATHDLEICRYADRVFRIDSGRLRQE